jgi:hypothetical protein
MLIVDLYHVPTAMALGFVVFVLLASIIASKIWPKVESEEPNEDAHSPS